MENIEEKTSKFTVTKTETNYIRTRRKINVKCA